MEDKVVKFSKVYFQTSLHIPRAGEVGAHLPTELNRQVDISSSPEGVVLFFHKQKVKAIVPWANVKCAVFANE